MSQAFRRRRCTGCNRAKDAEEFSAPMLKAAEADRLCKECELKAAAAARLAAEQEAQVQNSRGRSPGRRASVAGGLSPAASGGVATPGGASSGLATPGSGLLTPGGAGRAQSPGASSRSRAAPNQEPPVPRRFVGPNVTPARAQYCVVCKQAKSEFSATMAHAAHEQRMCTACEALHPQGFVPPKPAVYYIGVDAGRTFTDLVLVSRSDEKDPDVIRVVESCKEPTTADVTMGIVKGVRHILGKCGIAPGAVASISIGTCALLDALTERSSEQLAPVAVLRIGGAGVSGVQPFSTLPKDLQAIVAADYAIVSGGLDAEGGQFSPLDREGIRAFARRCVSKGVLNIAINSLFSSVRPDEELEAEGLIRNEVSKQLGPQRTKAELRITLASEVGSGAADLLLREHAAVVNAALRPFCANQVVASLYSAFRSDVLPMGNSKIFLTQSDGTLVDLATAARLPVLLLRSSTVNALSGAVLLCKAGGLIPPGTQGSVTFNTLAIALPLLRRSRHVTTYDYNTHGFEPDEIRLMNERIAVKLGKANGKPTEEEKRDLIAFGYYKTFAPNGGNLSLDGFVEFANVALRAKLSSAELKQLFNTLDVGGTRCIVADVGATHTNVGVVERTGFARMQDGGSVVGGVRLDSRLPEVCTMTQLGGASVIRMEEIKGTGGKMAFEIGATSVGGSLTSQRDGGKCFMGPHLTLTDLAVTLAKTQIGGADAARASKSFRSRQDAEACYEIVRRSLEKEVNLLKQDATELPLILVGGGNLLFAGDTKFAGVSKVLKPEHSEVASAIGAVAAKVGASIPYTLVSARDFPPTKTNTSAEIIETSFKRQLVQKCASQGAVADSVVVTDFEVVPALHMDGEFYAVRGRAQGKVDVARVNSALGSDAELIELLQTVPPLERNLDDEGTYRHEHERTKFLTESYLPAAPSALAALPPPNVRGGVWTLSPVDVECIAVGAAVLGAGTNSGQPRVALWRVLNAIVEGRRELRVISPKLLDKSRHVVFPVAFAGSAAIGGELIGSGAEFGAALANSQQLCDKQIAGKDTVLLAACMAGASGLEALAAAAQTGLPILDADAMGRSLPQLRHAMSFHLAGSALSPISICGAARNGTEFRPSAVKETSFEKIEQQVQTQLVQKHGGVAALCLPPLNADQVKDTGLCFGSISLAYNVGRAIVSARAAKQDPVRAAVAALGGKVLFAGSVAAVTPATGKRFAAGYITVKSENAANALQEAAVRVYHISENITVQNAANNQYLATVPDAIAVLDADTGAGLSVDEYAFGQRVVVVVIPSHAAFRSGSLLHESSPRRLDKDLVVEPVLAQPPRGNVISLCD